MKLSTRSFPHPVVGNRDDVPGAAFQAVIEMTTDKQTVYLDVSINSSSSTVNGLIKGGKGCFVLHVECTNTLFRRAYEFSGTSYRCAIPTDKLNESVEVNVFARATKHISGYSVQKANAEYGSTNFEIESADILAVAEGQIFQVESNFDSLSRIGSIMHVIESTEDGDVPMKADFNGDKIVIILSKKDFSDYKALKSNESIAVPLTTTIVVPVLLEALHILEKNKGDEDMRWVRALQRRIDELQLQSKPEPLELAQRILELPVRRSLASARMLAEAATS